VYTHVVNVLLTSIGTAGDVYPFIGLGIALRRRGHRATLLVNEHFKSLVTSNDLEFAPLGTAEEYHKALMDSQEYQKSLQDPKFWKQFDGVKTLVESICDTMRAQYDAVTQRYEAGSTVVVASGAGFGVRVAQEKFSIPVATVVLQPAALRSAHAMPRVAGAPYLPRWLPPFSKRFFFRFADVILDRLFHAPEVNAFRAELGLPEVRRMMKDWWLSPQRVITLFPDWFCERQPDWPESLRMTGFPLYDGQADDAALPEDVRSFLDQGEPPIVFTPGSGMMQGHMFFQTGADACKLLGARGVFLTRHLDQIPRSLPESVRHFSYVPLSRLLPRSSALVHHGGIGTLSQAMGAGIPQLIMPMAYDQPDNAARIRKLGVGDWLKPKAFRAEAVANKLERLTRSPEVAERCRSIAGRVDGGRAIDQTCDLIEDLAARRASTTNKSSRFVSVESTS